MTAARSPAPPDVRRPAPSGCSACRSARCSGRAARSSCCSSPARRCSWRSWPASSRAAASCRCASTARRWTAASIFGMMIWVFFLRFIVPVLGVFYGTSLIADEVEDRTITYLFTRPIRRGAVLVGKYLAYLVCTTLVVLPVGGARLLPARAARPGGADVHVVCRRPRAAGAGPGRLRRPVRAGRRRAQAAARVGPGLRVRVGADCAARARLLQAVHRGPLRPGAGAARHALRRGGRRCCRASSRTIRRRWCACWRWPGSWSAPSGWRARTVESREYVLDQ